MQAEFPRQIALRGLGVFQTQVIKAQIGRYAGLIMVAEQLLAAYHIAPFGKALAPPFVIFRDRVELWQVKGHRLDLTVNNGCGQDFGFGCGLRGQARLARKGGQHRQNGCPAGKAALSLRLHLEGPDRRAKSAQQDRAQPDCPPGWQNQWVLGQRQSQTGQGRAQGI